MFVPGGKYLFGHNRFPLRKPNQRLAPLEPIHQNEDLPSGVIFNEKKPKKQVYSDLSKISDLRSTHQYNVFYKNAKFLKKKLNQKKLESSQSFIAKHQSLPEIKMNPFATSPKNRLPDDRALLEPISRGEVISPHHNPNQSIQADKSINILLQKEELQLRENDSPEGMYLAGKSENLHETPKRKEITEPENKNAIQSDPSTNNKTENNNKETLLKPLHSTHYALKSPRSNRITHESTTDAPQFQMNKNNILIRSMNFWNYKPDYVRDLDGKFHFHNKQYVRKVDPTLYLPN